MNKYPIIIITAITFACSPSKDEYTHLLNTNDALTKENKILKDSVRLVVNELNAYKYSPEKLCHNIDELYKNEDLASLDSIKNILAIYHPESKEYKNVVTLCYKLKTAQRERAESEKRKKLQAVNRLKKVHDDISNITWYYNPYFTHYNNTNHISIYMGQEAQNIWLRMKMSYTGDNWIFFNNAYLSNDGNTKEINFDKYRDKESDNDTRVWEWIDVPVNGDLLSFLKRMVKGKSIKMRLTGKYTYTKNLTSTEIKAIEDVIMAYEVLRNDIN